MLQIWSGASDAYGHKYFADILPMTVQMQLSAALSGLHETTTHLAPGRDARDLDRPNIRSVLSAASYPPPLPNGYGFFGYTFTVYCCKSCCNYSWNDLWGQTVVSKSAPVFLE